MHQPTCHCRESDALHERAAPEVIGHLNPVDFDHFGIREYACPNTLVHWLVVRSGDGVRLERWTPGPLISVG